MKKPDKIRLRTRGPYVVAVMPEGTGTFILEELVAELRRTHRKVTLTAIADEYGESERNFRRYLRGKRMPVAKARRFARRLKDLHFATLAALERLSESHSRGQDAAELIREAKNAYEDGYSGLSAALDEHDDIVRSERAALPLRRAQADAETLARESARTRSRYEQLKLPLASSRNVFAKEWPPPSGHTGSSAGRDSLLATHHRTLGP